MRNASSILCFAKRFRFALLSVSFLVAFAAHGTTYYVATGGDDSASGDEGAPLATVATALAKSDVTEVVIGAGTYAQTAVISLTKAVTLRGATGVATDVTLDFQNKCQGLSLNHASAVVQDLRIYRASGNVSGIGVAIGTNGGTVRNCRIQECYMGNQDRTGVVYLNSANALMTGCEVRSCGATGRNGDLGCIGVYVGGGATLENTLVVGTRETSAYADTKARRYAVQLANGKVKNCTITGNTISDYALHCADSANCEVTDTICWNNTSLRGLEENGPNVNVLGTKCVVNNLCLQNPMFQDAANGDYTLAPGSPCIGAGTGGGDLGYKPYDSTKAALGIKASVRTGTAPLSVKVELTSANVDLAGATVTWEGLAETGTSFTHSFGGGNHALKATVTLSDSTVMTAYDPKALEIAYAPGEYTASTADELDAMLLAPQADGVTFNLLADTTYTLPQNCYKLIKAVKVVGAGRESTILKKKSGGRFFYLNNEKSEIDSLTMTGGSVGGYGGGIWIDTNGGTVSNCVISSCSAGSSQWGGAAWLNGVNSRITHCKVANNVISANGSCGGVLLSYGTVANSLLTGNTGQYPGRSGCQGMGVYMDKATADAKVINCTIANNTGYSNVGLYRCANGGYVYNTLVYGNTPTQTSAEPNFGSGGGTTRTTEDAIRNCCTDKLIGTNPQQVSEAPYDPTTYELVGEKAGACINKGDKTLIDEKTDYLGAARVVGSQVDIGAIEYASTEITVGIVAPTVTGVDSAELSFDASVQGAELADCTFAWYVDGSSTAAGTLASFTNTFTAGHHSLKLVVTTGGEEYPVEKPSDYISIYSSHSYVDVSSKAEPVWPYPQDHPATNFDAAACGALVNGVTLHVAEGSYWTTNRLIMGANMSVVGAGLDKTVVYYPAKTKGYAGFLLQNKTSIVSGLCVSNSLASGGGGFYICAGTVTGCKVTHCDAGANESGGGVQVSGSNSLFEDGIITDCSRYQVNVQHLQSGGGVGVSEGGKLRNTLVTRCYSNCGGGVQVVNDASAVENCTIVGNWSTNTTTSGTGGMIVSAGSVRNCIVWGNEDRDVDDPASARHNLTGASAKSSNNCSPVAFGANAVTGDPCFRDFDGGDFRLMPGSPCRYAGVCRDWMVGATDFFGNPRTVGSPRHPHVDIGMHQQPGKGLSVIVR